MAVELSATAETDLRGIYGWTDRTFGPMQAGRYIRALYADMDRAEASPRIGSVYPGAEPEARRLLSGRRYIYYRAIDTGLRVVRALHVRMQQSIHRT